MWQRFSEKARQAVYFAQQTAEQYGDTVVDTDHLLLGMMHDSDNAACRALHTLAIEPENIRAQLQPQMARRDSPKTKDMQLSAQAKKMIDAAYEESQTLGNRYIGTEHFLLGLLRDNKGRAGETLFELRVRYEDVLNATRPDEGREK